MQTSKLFLLLLCLTQLVRSAPYTAKTVKEFRGHGVRFSEDPVATRYDRSQLQDFVQNAGCPPSPGPPTNLSPNEHYFSEAVLDNFAAAGSAGSACTWSQRFFLNTTFCSHDKCPVFLYIGGEGPLTHGSIGTRLFMHTLAKEHGAVVVSLEHRYYGMSWPTHDMSTAYLKSYLSSGQALADLAHFQKWFGPQGNSNHFFPKYQLGESDWVAFGGSYPGNLAAWLKVKYPQSFIGTVASSAPITALENWPGYMKVVSDSLKYFGGQECFNAIQTSTNRVMNYVNNNDWKTLNNMWDTCEPQLSDESKTNGDLSTFLSNLQSLFQGLVQYNRDSPEAPTVKSTCVQLLHDPTKTFETFVNLTKNSKRCTDISTNETYAALKNVTLTGGSSSAMRPWIFQTCNEFGYFQVVGTDPTSDAFSKMSPYVNVQSYTDICDVVFEMNGASPRIAWSNTQYGVPSTLAAVNVTFPSGSLDPWHVLGVTNDTHPWTPNDAARPATTTTTTTTTTLASAATTGIFAAELAVEIPHTSHCQDMYATDFSIPEIAWAHTVIRSRVAHYLSSYVAPPSPTPSPPPPPPPPQPLTPSSSSSLSSPSPDSSSPSSTPSTPSSRTPSTPTSQVINYVPIIIAAVCGLLIGLAQHRVAGWCCSKDRKNKSRPLSHSNSNVNSFETDYHVMGGGDTYEDI